MQGLGAAGLLSVTFVLIAHIRADRRTRTGAPTRRRRRCWRRAWCWGRCSAGSIVEHVGWRWIFWLNVPVTAAVFAVIALCLRIETERSHEPIDWRAAAFLALAAERSSSSASASAPTPAGRLGARRGRCRRPRRAARPPRSASAARRSRSSRPSFSPTPPSAASACCSWRPGRDGRLDRLRHPRSPTPARLLPARSGAADDPAGGRSPRRRRSPASSSQRRGGSLRPSFVSAGAPAAVALGVLAAAVEVGPVALVMQGALGLLGARRRAQPRQRAPRDPGAGAAPPARDRDQRGALRRDARHLGRGGALRRPLRALVARPGAAGDGLHASLTLVFALGGLTMVGATWPRAAPARRSLRPPRAGTCRPGRAPATGAGRRSLTIAAPRAATIARC